MSDFRRTSQSFFEKVYREQILFYAAKLGYRWQHKEGDEWHFYWRTNHYCITQFSPGTDEKAWLDQVQADLTNYAIDDEDHLISQEDRIKESSYDHSEAEFPDAVDENFDCNNYYETDSNYDCIQSFIVNPVFGKWIIQIRYDNEKEVWKYVASAVSLNALTHYACMVDHKIPDKPYKDRYYIYIYTYNYADLNEAIEMRRRLTEMGFTKPLYYKSADITSTGSYGHKLHV